MSTLQDKMTRQALGDALLNLTNDLDAVTGLKLTSTSTAEIWVSNTTVHTEIKKRCAEHKVLSTLELTFREELDEATAPGGASAKPPSWEPKNDPSTPASADRDDPTAEVGE
jgi:hypothetical protein